MAIDFQVGYISQPFCAGMTDCSNIASLPSDGDLSGSCAPSVAVCILTAGMQCLPWPDVPTQLLLILQMAEATVPQGLPLNSILQEETKGTRLSNVIKMESEHLCHNSFNL